MQLLIGLLHHLFHDLPRWLDILDGSSALASQEDAPLPLLPPR